MVNKQITNVVGIEDRLDRIKKAIAYLKGGQRISKNQDIVDEMKINKSSLSQALNGNPKYLTDAFLERFAKQYSFSLNWLKGGEGDMLDKDEILAKNGDQSDIDELNEPPQIYSSGNVNQSRKSDVIIRDKFDDNQKGVPALPIRVQGGFTRHYSDPVFWKDLERVFIPGMPYDGDEYLWAEMEGDSMEYIDPNTGLAAGIPDRAWCIYQRVPQEFWRRGLRQFYVYLVITETRFTVKRILQDNDEEIVLSPDNEDYPQERVHLSEVQGIYIFKRKLDWNAPPPRKHEIKV